MYVATIAAIDPAFAVHKAAIAATKKVSPRNSNIVCTHAILYGMHPAGRLAAARMIHSI